MSSRLHAVAVAAQDPLAVATFWAAVLRSADPVETAPGAWTLRREAAPGFGITVAASDDRKVGPNRIHFDLTSTSLEDQQSTVDRALAAGGRHLDVGQLPEDGHVVLADPEGNALCVIEPGNTFLADTAEIGALSCDGSRAVGLFWSAALGWPLVWDEGEETAIQSPEGGSKISWGGGPDYPEQGRIHLDLAPEDDQQTEIDRLVALGARTREVTADGRAILLDPDDNAFCVLPAPVVE